MAHELADLCDATTPAFAIGIECSGIIRHRVRVGIGAGVAGQACEERLGAQGIRFAIIFVFGDGADIGGVDQLFALNAVFRQPTSGEERAFCFESGADVADGFEDLGFAFGACILGRFWFSFWLIRHHVSSSYSENARRGGVVRSERD